MSKFISYGEVPEENTGKRNQVEYIYLLVFFLFFFFFPLILKTCTAGISPFD